MMNEVFFSIYHSRNVSCSKKELINKDVQQYSMIRSNNYSQQEQIKQKNQQLHFTTMKKRCQHNEDWTLEIKQK